MSKQDVWAILDEFRDLDLLEDRLEYPVEDLKVSLDLTDQEAADLYYLVQREDDSERQTSLDSLKGDDILEGIQEAIHGGLDGWDAHDQVVITRFIDDLKVYALAKNSP